MHLRPATPADFAGIDAWDPMGGDREGEIAQNRCIIAEIEDRPVGYLSFDPWGLLGKPYITFCAVRPSHQRQGIALALIEAAMQKFAGRRVFISTEEGNTPMRKLLEPRGWISCGVIHAVNDSGSPELFYYRDVPG
jgi:ribosomal protein S18 acetylase RimI-like enzyme